MKKKTYELLLVLAVIVCAVIGIRIHIGHSGWYDAQENAGQKYVKTQTLDSFTGIDADVPALDISIEQGDSLSCTYHCSKESEVPQVSVENGILKVTQNNHEDAPFWITGGASSLQITVPEGTELDGITVRSGAGDLQLTYLKTGSVTADLSAGDLYMDNVQTNKVSAGMDAGDFSADLCSLGETEFDLSAGDCDISESSIDGCQITSSAGDVTMDLKGDKSDYSFDISTSAGEVEIDGDLHETEYQHQGGAGMIRADLSAGDVSINFSD